MPRPTKGGRKKRDWDVAATVTALDRTLGDEPDPGDADLKRSFLHFMRAYCRSLAQSQNASAALHKLLALMGTKSGPIQQYAREVADTYAQYEPLMPTFHELFGRGERKDLWRLWFFSCEMPRKLHKCASDLGDLLRAGSTSMPAEFRIPGRAHIVARFLLLSGLRSYGYDLASITRLLDPAGHASDRTRARDRIRKEVARMEALRRLSTSESGSETRETRLAPRTEK